MNLDAYQPCPCDSGEKVKFCCCKDILPDLEKVNRLLSNNQAAAAAEHIQRLVQSKGPRPALLVLRGSIAMQTGDFATLRSCGEQLLSQRNDDPVGWVYLGLAELENGIDGLREATHKIQRALEGPFERPGPIVHGCFRSLARSLAEGGHYLAAFAHYLRTNALSGGRDQETMQEFQMLMQQRNIPLLFKGRHPLPERPDDAPWGAEFDEAIAPAARGAWLAAAERLTTLAEKYPQVPEIWQSLGVLRERVVDYAGAAQAWRKYVAVGNPPLDDAVEAEALAQLFDQWYGDDHVANVAYMFDIQDLDVVQERMLSDRRLVRRPVETTEADEPPPRSSFYIFDKAPSTLDTTSPMVDRTCEQVGVALLYGKQTDRPAQIHMVASRDGRSELALEIIRSLTDGPPTCVETVISEVPSTEAFISRQWRMPSDVTQESFQGVLNDLLHRQIFEKWPQTPLRALDGKTPTEAARDPQYRHRVLAAILNLQHSPANRLGDDEFNRLRQQLDLPTLDPIELQDSRALLELPMVRLGRLVADKLSTSLLDQATMQAMTCGHVAVFALGGELLKRPDARTPRETLHGVMAELSSHPAERLQHLVIASKEAELAGRSPARWLLAQLPLLLQIGASRALESTIARLHNKHIDEPGVYERLSTFIMALQNMAAEAEARSGAAPAARPEAAATPNSLWVPGAAPAEAAAAPAKSGLWLPGST